MNGSVVVICICPLAGAPMKMVYNVEAIAGEGLKGDRYWAGEGSYNQGKVGNRQVTLMNTRFFKNGPFVYTDARRNIFTRDVELMDLIGKDFQIGPVHMRGIKYCYPCERPGDLCGKPKFQDLFHDCAGLIAEITQGGILTR